MTNYPAPGNIAHLTCRFINQDGDPVDPTTVTVTVKSPTLAPATHTAVKDAVGVYHYDLLLTEPGAWLYRFTGTGTVTAQTDDITLNVETQDF